MASAAELKSGGTFAMPERAALFLFFLWEARVLGLQVEFLEVPEPYVWVVKEYGWPL